MVFWTTFIIVFLTIWLGLGILIYLMNRSKERDFSDVDMSNLTPLPEVPKIDLKEMIELRKKGLI